MKKQKGITLIALIITIIVMLILVGVTINVALNGGLFEKTKNATTKTQKELEKEELISIAIGAYSSKNDSVTLSDLTTAIDTTKFKYDEEKSVADSTYVLKGPSGIYWEINLITAEVKEYEEKTSIYKVAYVCEVSEDDFSMEVDIYLINSEIMYLEQYANGELFITAFANYDLDDLSFSSDNVTMNFDGNTYIRGTDLFTYSPTNRDETSGVYTNALYTSNSTSTLLQTTNSEGRYVLRDTEDTDVELDDIPSRNDITVSQDGTTITWIDGNTYQFVNSF